MRNATLFCICIITILFAVKDSCANDRPNLIWIMADDLGFGELGCYGQREIPTPNIDRLAAEGLRFTHFYAGATVCAPSRSVLMTGLHHGHTRVRGNAGQANPAAQALRKEDITVAEMLKSVGYRTALTGKWGLGDVGKGASGLPNSQGFDFFYGYLNQTHAHNHFPDYLWRNTTKEELPNIVTPVGEGGGGYSTKAVVYADHRIAEEAIQFIQENRDQPFFLYWSLVIPHANNEKNRILKDGTEAPDLGEFASRDWKKQDKGHAAMVSLMDQYVGKVVEKVREAGLERKTLIIFTSDNGPHNESNHTLTKFQPSGPYSGIKRALTDGGIRVPCVAWWPGTIQPGRTTDHVAYFGDWMATAAELGHAKLPLDRDSISFVPTLLQRGEQKQHDFLYWEFHEGGFKQAALYQGRWKGIRSGSPDAPVQLFDTDKDPAETNDVANANPEITKQIDEYLKSARSDSSDWIPRWK